MKFLKTGLLIMLSVFFLFSCKKENTNDDTSSVTITDTSDSNSTVSRGQLYYIKYNQVWSVKNEDDLGKKYDEVKEKKLMDFGNDGTVVKTKTVDGKEYVKMKIPGDEVWVEKDYVTERFIVIKDIDVKVYKSPGDNYLNKDIKLQQGDLGFFIKEDNGFINISIQRYLPRKKDGSVSWIADVWIKDGFIDDDFETVREAHQLTKAYQYLYNPKSINTDKAIEILKTTVEDFQSSPTQISGITTNLLMNLQGETSAESTTTTVQ